MTRQKTLKEFSNFVIKDTIDIFNDFLLQRPLKQKKEKIYKFKIESFNKEVFVEKNDFGEFFSRKGIKPALEKIDDFDDVVDIISGYTNTKIYSKRGFNAKNLLHTFIENYFIYVEDTKFVESKFNEIFKSFEKFLNSDILYAHFFTPLFRFEFSSRYVQKDFGGFYITKINEKILKIIKESLVGNSSTPGFIRGLSYVLETSIPFQNNPEDENELARIKFKKFLNVSHLFLESDLKLGPIYKNYTTWMINSSKILNREDVHLGPRVFKLNSNSYNKLKIFYHEFSSINFKDKDWPFLKVALDRFSLSLLRNNPVDKLVDLNVALEGLFSSPGETSLKISNRTAMMVGPDENKQEECWNFIRSTYRLRNAVLHGRIGNEFDMMPDIIELEKIIRLSIRKFLNLSKNLSRTELKSKGELSGGKNIRDYILNELDLGLINRLRLNDFSIKFHGPFD